SKKKKQFLQKIKSFEIKLGSILRKETAIEDKIEEIEKIEKIVFPKSKIEKKRWKMENKRRKVEKKKWHVQEQIKETEGKIKTAELKENEFSEKKTKLEEKKEKLSRKLEELARKKIQFLKGFLGDKGEENKLEKDKQVQDEEKTRQEEIRIVEELRKEREEEGQRQVEEMKRIEELKIKQEEEKQKQGEIKKEEIKKIEETKEEQERVKTQLLLPPGIEQINKKETERASIPSSKTVQTIEVKIEPGFLAKVFNKLPFYAKSAASPTQKAIKEKVIEEKEGLRTIELEKINRNELKRQYEQASEKQIKQLEGQKEELIKQYERELVKQREELIKRHEEELERKKQEEKIIKEKYVPYVPEEIVKQQELIKQLEKEQENLKQKHRKELEEQAEGIRQQQREELERQEEEWKKKQEELTKEKPWKRKKEELKEGDEMKLFREQVKKKKEDLEAKRKTIEEEVRRIEQEELIREELKKKREEPMREDEVQLSEKQMKKKKEELELRRKSIEDEVKKIEQEELAREKLERKKKEEKERKEKEETEKQKRTEISEKREEPIIIDKKELEKEKLLRKEEIRERQRKEKELLPAFEQAVKYYKEKEFDKAGELFAKLKEQAVEPEKEPKFFDKLLNKVPLYIKIENYLKEIEKEKVIQEKKAATATKKKAREKKKEKKQDTSVQKEELKKRSIGSAFLNLFGRVRFAQPTIGIDISDYSIEILYLSKQKSILDYGRTIIREGIIRDGEIMNQKDLTEAFRLTAQRAGLQPFDPRKGPLLKAIVSLPESKTYIQIFTFDSKDNLLKKVKEKIESTIPFPINELYWSYIESWDQNSGKTKVLCAAAPKDVVNSQVHFLRSSGMNPVVFDIESASMGRALLSEQKSESGTVILDIGARTTNLSIFDKKGFLSFSVTIRCAGFDFANRIADHLGVPKEKAETMMGEKGFKQEDNPILPILEEEVEKIVKETQRSIDYYQKEFEEKIEKIILAGGFSLAPGIAGFFQKRFESIKVELGDPLGKIKRKGGMREERAILYSNVIGLALRSISKNPVKDGINLSPEEIKSRGR
ncbi:MAG TPA: pilus assembly protein PilM, partial [Candidatus Paceibacterota bacterium]|nr:pilus assembly protein PilM [Candidatus Paceibacterota bacterium]